MKPIATDTYNFEQLIEDGFTYVDKTAVLYRLVNKSIGKQFFLSRPRRFGKSLLVSTFKSLFEGKRNLFKGLAIDSLDFEWKKYPVLHLDMGSMQAPTVAEFEEKLLNQLMSLAKELGVEVEKSSISSIVFTRLCEALAAKSPHKQFVMLVDEYDKPLLGTLNTPEVVEFRDALKSFYSVIKTKESLMRFTFITGISKFSKVSIFSDLNNLIDISMSAQFATLLGYTHDEVKKFFPDWIEKLAGALGVSSDEAFDEIVKWYDGYRFEENAEPVINPVSLGLCLRDSKFKTYWSSTAVPTFLVDLLKKRPINLQLAGIDESTLDAYEPTALNPVTLLYQTGYLTISSFRQRATQRTYSLDFPNMEVRNSFNTSLARGYVNIDENHLGSLQNRCIDALYDNELDIFFETLKIFFANIPYDISSRAPEETYQAIFCAILYFIGVGVTPEVRTNEGRIDAVMETPDHVYVMEFKRDKSAAEALEQIKEKKYYEKFLGSGKKITLVGVNFDSEKRTIAEYVTECVNVPLNR
ncbi:MAG: ATP-binding protein [Kiritimatiellae bacterium]|nr:ATP-binding protein [Kiritimatiellia bacterium]